MLARFRLTTDPSSTAEGWRIDNIAVSDALDTVPTPVIDQVLSHSVRVNWAVNTNALFGYYAIFRSTSPGVSINSTLVGIVPRQDVTSFTNTGLLVDTLYYYRVYAVNPWGAFSADCPTEGSVRTLNHPLPFADDFEGSLLAWNSNGGWGLQTNDTGGFMLADTPYTTYSPGTNSSVWLSVDLQNTSWPVLRFKDRYNLGSGDWIRLQVSAAGYPTWYMYGMYQSTRTNWAEQVVDLSRWRGCGNVQILFQLVANGDGSTGDGWFIDDVRVEDQVPATISLPMHDGFETGLTNWQAAGWGVDTNTALVGTLTAREQVGTIGPEVGHWMQLAGTLNLTGMVNPRVVCWAKGSLPGATAFRVSVSTDGGVSWPELSSMNLDSGFNADWTRRQGDLSSYRTTNTRIRAIVYSYWGDVQNCDIQLDKFTIEEAPPAVNLNVPVPALKSVSLGWAMSGLGSDFKRYELYRSTDTTVDLSDTCVAQITNISTLAFVDSGLSIGATYYYGIFVVNTNDVYSSVNTRPATTVPMTLPVIDGMDSMDNWAWTGSWGPDSNTFLSGTASLNDSPGGNYSPGSSGYIFTALDLQNTSWPVLRFKDRYSLGAGDWIRLQVSAAGYPTWYVYGMYASSRTNWAEQVVDLSRWRGCGNVQILFQLAANGDGSTGDGWFIDDVRVEDQVPATISLPMHDGFETGLTNWQAAGWGVDTNTALVGALTAREQAGNIGPDVGHWLQLAGTLNLTGMVNPRVVCWAKGSLPGATAFRVQVSTDGGVNWPDLSSMNLDSGFNADWTRRQGDLSSYRTTNTRIRAIVYSYWGDVQNCDIQLDKFTIEEAPQPVILNAVTANAVGELALSWSPYASPDFKEYRIFRSTGSGVSESSTLLGVFTNSAVTNFTDTGLVARTVYFYRVFVYNTNDTGTASDESSGRTLGVPMGWVDNGNTLQPAWTRTGTWTNLPGVGRAGSQGLVDSPGDYAYSSDYSIQTAIDLTTAQWPVLKFWDRFSLNNGDWIAVDVWREGAGVTRTYGSYMGARTNWQQQVIDLSPWKGYGSVYVRFHVATDGGTPGDGWYLDDISFEENSAPAIAYPFFDGFESASNNWLAQSWTRVTNDPYAGSWAANDTLPGRMWPDGQCWLTLAGELDLTGATNSALTALVRGSLPGPSQFRAQISTDGGRGWTELSAMNLDSGFNSGWVRKQASLAAYATNHVRIRLLTDSYWGDVPDTDIFLDNIGIGGPAPASPVVASPAIFESVGVLRPTLVVTNAIEYQSDPLTYRFEVYSDAGLSNTVAQVPAIASGSTTTVWQVDINLANNAQYWWRCRASDGSNDGPWMTTATFYINETNAPPNIVAIAGPPKGATLRTASGIISWYPTTDPDIGDTIATYNIQIDDDPAFASPNVNATFPAPAPTGAYVTISRPLDSLTGWTGLGMVSNYYWRIRAQDSRFAWSTWTVGGHWFIYGVPAPDGANFRRNANGTMTLDWDVGTENFYVYWSPTLTGNWQIVAGPLGVNTWTFTPTNGTARGFFRISGE